VNTVYKKNKYIKI